MRIWLGLLLAPLLALADQTIAYATSGWECAHQNVVALHGLHGTFLAATLVTAAMGWMLWRETLPLKDSSETLARRHFLAGIATGSGLLSALAIAAMWFPAWTLSPCLN
jgi:hypothetical protein